MNVSTILTVIGVIISIGVFIVAVASLHRKSINDTSCKVKRVYARQDEVKKALEIKIETQDKENKEQFVDRQVCKVILENNKENFRRLEKQLSDGFRSINEAMTDMNKTIMQLLRKNGIS